MADDSVSVPDEQLRLYEVHISKLFLDGDLNQKLSLSLASITNDLLNESYLKSISTDPRRRLYVLIDPIESWKERGDPTVYCVIQGGLMKENKLNCYDPPKINAYLTLRRAERLAEIILGSTLIPHFPQLKSKTVVGAQIICLYQAKDGNVKGYASKALDRLTRPYDEKEVMNSEELDLLFSPRKNWTKKLHYLRIDIALDFKEIIRWERYGFFALLVLETRSKTYSLLMFKPLPGYELEISSNDEKCSLPTLAEQSRNKFLGLLSSNLSNLDHDLSMRLLERFSRIIHAKKLPLDKIWRPRAEFVDALTGPVGQLSPEQDKAGHLDFASGYFTGKLPIELSGDEQATLLYLLQNRGNLPLDEKALCSLASTHDKVGRFYRTLSPEVEPLLLPFLWNKKDGELSGQSN